MKRTAYIMYRDAEFGTINWCEQEESYEYYLLTPNEEIRLFKENFDFWCSTGHCPLIEISCQPHEEEWWEELSRKLKGDITIMLKQESMVRFTHKGGKTTAKDYEYALFYWYWGRNSMKLKTVPSTLTIFNQNDLKFPAKGDLFIDLVIAACEREWGDAPAKEIQKPVFFGLFKRNERYSEKCKRIMDWLAENGDVKYI